MENKNDICKPIEPKGIFYALSFFFWLFGLVMGIYYLGKESKECQKFGRICLILAIAPAALGVVIVIGIAIVIFFVGGYPQAMCTLGSDKHCIEADPCWLEGACSGTGSEDGYYTDDYYNDDFGDDLELYDELEKEDYNY